MTMISSHIVHYLLDASTTDEKSKAYWERTCLRIVRERTALQRSEEELSMAKRGLTLENERARADSEYRQLINLPGRLDYYQLSTVIERFTSSIYLYFDTWTFLSS
jgi:hypothetical protein